MDNEYEIVSMLKEDDGVLISQLIDNDFKKEVLKCEMKRFPEVVPFINKGMEDAFNEEEALVLIKKHDPNHKREIKSDNSTFTLRTENGDIVGETITDEEELEELRNDPGVYFLSDNFVTYTNIGMPNQKQFFVMEGETSDFITNKDIDSTVKSLVVAIPSTQTDHYIKDYYNIPHDEDIGTIIIGFTPRC